MADLNRGDGVCIHFDIESKHCAIYQIRPDKCRVDRYYIQYFQQQYSWSEFVELNLKICEQLPQRF